MCFIPCFGVKAIQSTECVLENKTSLGKTWKEKKKKASIENQFLKDKIFKSSETAIWKVGLSNS